MTTGNDQFEREFADFLAAERSRVAELYRKLPQPEPDARLDAAVRAMAHRALNPQLVATPRGMPRRRRAARWIPALGAAAGVVLAAGIAYRMGPSLNQRNETAPAREDVISVRAIDAPAPRPPLSPPATTPASDGGAGTRAGAPTAAGASLPTAKSAAATPPAAATTAQPVARDEAQAFPAVQRPQAHAAPGEFGNLGRSAEKVRPQAFAPPAQRQRATSEAEAVERRETMAEGAWQNLRDRDSRSEAKPEESGAARAKMAAPPPAAPPPAAPAAASASTLATPAAAPPPRESAERAPTEFDARKAPRAGRAEPAPAAKAAGGEAGPLDTHANRAADALEQRAMPASNDPNARLYPEHWLQNIRTMLRAGRREQALRSLGEFRRLYPDYRLPDDLRDLK